MTVKEGFMLREVGATKVILPIGKESANFRALAHINSSGAIIFNGFKNNKSADEIADELTQAFNVEFDKARRDVDIYAQKLIDAGIMNP